MEIFVDDLILGKLFKKSGVGLDVVIIVHILYCIGVPKK